MDKSMGLVRDNIMSIKCQNNTAESRFIGRFIAEDGGFTSVGVVVALLLVVTLLFATAQIRWMSSTSADIQFVADSGALAAQNVVAEYEVIAKIADAVILSMSLFGLLVFGIAIVVSCIPGCQEVGVEVLDFGKQVFEARDTCAKQLIKGLNALQRALPFLCVVNAARVISSNQISAAGNVRYYGLAIPLPLTGKDTVYPDDDDAQNSGDEISRHNSHTSELTDEAQEAYERMQASRREGYLADCGQNPAYCLYERAARLGGLNGAQNPFFSSPDTWLFDYAFMRAKAYYQARLANERPASSALDEQVRSFARTRFYSFAVSEMAHGYARTAEDGTLDAYFPLLPRNNTELRTTSLYTEKVYPVSAGGVIHGVSNCPDCVDSGLVGYGSVAQSENGTYQACKTCDFSINTIGRVASASTSINNGFEFHYRAVAEAATRYQQASKEYRNSTDQAKESAEGSFEAFRQALEALKAPRINPCPPGRNGCIAIVIDPSSHAIPAPFSSSLVGGNAELHPRVAISAAAMAADQASPGNNIISSFLDRVKENASGSSGLSMTLGFFDGILDVWGNALLAYTNGTEAMVRGVGDFLRGIPLVGSTPLASWAESALKETLEAVGLQGIDLSMPKPVIVNTLHVARASNSAVGDGFVTAKEIYSSVPGSGSGTLLHALVDGVAGGLEDQGAAFLDAEFTLFTISFGDTLGLPEIPIRISIPEQLATAGRNFLSDTRTSLHASLGGDHAIWE